MKKTASRRAFLSKSALVGAMGFTGLTQTFGKGYTNAVDDNPKLSAPTDLKITDVKVAYLRGGGRMFVKILTNQGLIGYGEGVDAVGGTYHLARRFGFQLRNQNPLNVHRLFDQIRKGGVFSGAQAGMYVAVLTAIETALWDVAGKALGVPVYQLLGGKFRDSVRVYMDTALYQNQLPKPEDFATAAKEAVGMGMTAVKFDLDQANDPNKYDRYNWTAGPAEIQRMYDQMAAARQAVGPNIDICADMHGRYDFPTAQRVAKILEPLNLMWLEEPIPAENVDAYAEIAKSTSTPICVGENVYLGYGFRPYLEKGAADIIMPDLQKAGGLGEGQRIANLANLYYVPFAPHMVASYLGAMAAAHVCASVPNFMILEWQIYYHKDPMWKEIVKFEGEFVEKGFIKLLDKPGIGVDLNEEALKKYAAPDVPFFE
ncbi:MAG: mandelate racemase/muconate lactonizing enzyme family protein [Haliscomenobacter sp.]|uniref:mandelate racemase/muconate lactonizing enzyme family protein n=1 Tax=Haliscomenobacter sp. TaxID=2717303 RepID=UPI0029AF8CD8|nr:mandelate racemase/muconate lactonizing enzyme family protein [Haliscomenobacter sp.]MDX2067898.1 mandelate racemase/muconate lactonizing enzyme family protein [Haliscomenobacter sp.]